MIDWYYARVVPKDMHKSGPTALADASIKEEGGNSFSKACISTPVYKYDPCANNSAYMWCFLRSCKPGINITLTVSRWSRTNFQRPSWHLGHAKLSFWYDLLSFDWLQAWDSKGLSVEECLLTCEGAKMCNRCTPENLWKYHGARYVIPFSLEFPHFEVITDYFT